MTPPRISIVTPSYNQARYLEQTIRSVLSQEYPNLEYIIIDGGSSDSSREIIDRYSPYLAHAVSEPDRGQAHAINKGMDLAGGDIVAFLNSDDLYRPTALNNVARYFIRNPDAQLIYAHADRVDAAGRTFERAIAPDFDLDRLLRVCFIRQPAVFMRRSLVEQVGLFDESLHRCMDYDYWLRASLLTRPRLVNFRAAADRFHRDAKSSGAVADTLREEVILVDRFLAQTELARLRPELARSALLPRLLILAGARSGADDTERSACLGRLQGFPPPSVDELADVIGGHDGYSASPYLAPSAGFGNLTDVHAVLPSLVSQGIIGHGVATETQRRLSVLAALRSAQTGNPRSYALKYARTVAQERWLLRSRPFWVQTARGSSAGRRLAPLVARAAEHRRRFTARRHRNFVREPVDGSA